MHAPGRLPISPTPNQSHPSYPEAICLATLMATIELNQQFQRALDLMEHSEQHLFITGRAGTGKSTLLTYFRGHTQKNVVVLAPTGVAALNVKGQTIHSFFGFRPDITVERVNETPKETVNSSVYKVVNTIVIDEISMVRADLLDCVDAFLRIHGRKKGKPFGGIQMVFIGDLYQLPPVVKGDEKDVFSSLYQTPYFFSSHALEGLELELIELEKIYRQHDQHFIDILNGIRNNTVTESELKSLNTRYLPDYEPPPEDFYVWLTTTKAMAAGINTQRLSRLPGKSHEFSGQVSGEFEGDYLPTSLNLKIKIGAQIMMLNNDSAGRWVNGTVARVSDVREVKNGPSVIVARLSNGDEVDVTPYNWQIFKFFVRDYLLETSVVGNFTQYPIMLAWAVTIHKGQGKTFDRVIIDMGKGAFAHGQNYVALSRCTSLEGLVLKKPILKRHIWMDYRVTRFLTNYQYDKAALSCTVADKISMIERAISEKRRLRIRYLKPNDEKSERTIIPRYVGEMSYEEVDYVGLQAFCLRRNEERVFRVDRILDIELL
jgi:ATP-dependent DNA helicase PIF1